MLKKIFLNLLIFINLFTFQLYSNNKTILYFGAKGWIGQKLVKIFEEYGYKVYCSQSRLENRESVEKEIIDLNPDYIFNSAGITGRPTVDWCEENKEETIRSNVLGLLNLVDVAFIHNIHVTNLATGCIYQYDEAHQLGSNIGFTEDEEPNFSGSFYSKTKILAEKLILNYPNILNLRLRMPISSDLHPRSFIGKIIRYKKLLDFPNSMSILDDLLPLVPIMLERGLTGNYNFVNPGVISHNQIMELYKIYINPDHYYENYTTEEQNKILKAPRSNCELDASRLLIEFPNIPSIQNSIIKVFEKIKKLHN